MGKNIIIGVVIISLVLGGILIFTLGFSNKNDKDLYTIERFISQVEESGMFTVTIIDSIERNGITAILIGVNDGDINDGIVLEVNSDGEVICFIDAGEKACGDIECLLNIGDPEQCGVTIEAYTDPDFEEV